MEIQQNQGSKVYTKSQSRTLSTALLTAGIGFLVTCLVGYLFSYLILSVNQSEFTLLGMAGGGLLIAFVLALVWSFNVEKWSINAGIAITTLYAVCEGIGFGSLFVFLQAREIMIIFGLVGFILVGSYCVSRILTAKGAMTLWKLATVLFVVYIVGALIVLLSTLFSGISEDTLKFYNITCFVGGLLSVFYIIYNLWAAKNLDVWLQDDQLKTKWGLIIGFNILMNLINLVWTLARFLRD